MTRLSPLTITASLLLIGCQEKTSDTGDSDQVIQNDDTDTYRFDLTEELTNPSGCADFVFFDRNDADTLSIEISGSGLAEAAHIAGEPVSISYDLADLPDDITVEHLTGAHLTHSLCNDALDPAIETQIEDIFVPVSGTLTLIATPDGEATDWGELPTELEVTIEVSDFCAEIGDGETHHENCFNVNEYSASANIGWLQG